jgi:cell division protein FtsI/penicillin-binding protein 2
MLKKKLTLQLLTVAGLTAAMLFPHAIGSPEQHSGGGTSQAAADAALPEIPAEIPAAGPDGVIYLQTPDGPRATTINPAMQAHLNQYLADFHSPIAAVVVADVKTGHILAMAQGRKPAEWETGKTVTHSALHSGFPAASLFKTVVTAAAFEMTDIDATVPDSLYGGCSHVRPTGVFMTTGEASRQNSMSLRKAYSMSCNGYFAKLAVNSLGLGIITNFARRFGWETGIPSDFHVERSPFRPPVPENSSAQTVGRFAAGFGYVGLSAVHSAWTMLAVARDGVPIPIKIFRDATAPETPMDAIISPRTARSIKEVMAGSVLNGTASHAFRRGKYRKLRELVGGKTGTLTGQSPKGLTTWFSGIAPLAAPEIVVASVVMLESRWYIKATHLAAEAFWSFYEQKAAQQALTTAAFAPAADAPQAEKK